MTEWQLQVSCAAGAVDREQRHGPDLRRNHVLYEQYEKAWWVEEQSTASDMKQVGRAPAWGESAAAPYATAASMKPFKPKLKHSYKFLLPLTT